MPRNLPLMYLFLPTILPSPSLINSSIVSSIAVVDVVVCVIVVVDDDAVVSIVVIVLLSFLSFFLSSLVDCLFVLFVFFQRSFFVFFNGQLTQHNRQTENSVEGEKREKTS